MSGRDVIARERIAALNRDIDRIDRAVDRLSRHRAVTHTDLERFKSEYREAHADLVTVVADLRTSLAVGPPEVRELIRQESGEAGRRLGIQTATSQLLALIGLVAVVAGTIGHFLK